MPPSASHVWKFFTKAADKKSATCNLCSMTLQLHGGTSNLNNHLKFKHPSENKNTQTKETLKQVPLTSFLSSPWKIGGSEQEKITQAIADMIVSEYVPLSIVSSKGFRNLMENVAPDYKVPCRKTIHSRIVRRYDGLTLYVITLIIDDFRNPTYGIDKTDFYRKTMVIIN